MDHKYDRDNKYGKAHEDASDALNRTVEQIDAEIGKFITAMFPEQSEKYKRGVRSPFFVQ